MPKENDFKIKLIKIVEQHPCLYNFRLPEYSRRDVVCEAWEKVAKEMNATVQVCKDTWRTLRISYTRAIKLPPSGTSAKKLTQNTMDMIKEMDFIRSYIHAKRSQEIPSNLPHLPSPESQDEISQEIAETDFKSEDDANIIEETVGNFQLISSDVRRPDKKLKVLRYSTDTTDSIDAQVLQFIKSKEDSKQEPENAKRLFLLSLLPDLEQMNNVQMRKFRRKVIDLIDEILGSESEPPPLQSPSALTWQTENSQSSTSRHFQEDTKNPWLVNNTMETTDPLQRNSKEYFN